MARFLTIKQPWASIIFEGGKTVENRTWKSEYRGKVYITTSQKFERIYTNTFTEQQTKSLKENYPNLLNRIKQENLPLGCVVGEVNLTNIIENSVSIWAVQNQYHWVFTNIKKYEKPIDLKSNGFKGGLGLWQSKELEELIEKELCKNKK